MVDVAPLNALNVCTYPEGLPEQSNSSTYRSIACVVPPQALATPMVITHSQQPSEHPQSGAHGTINPVPVDHVPIPSPYGQSVGSLVVLVSTNKPLANLNHTVGPSNSHVVLFNVGGLFSSQ